MQDGTRSALAAIAATLVNRRSYSYVADLTAGASRHVKVSIHGNSIDAYDFVGSSHIKGDMPGNLYHYGESCFIKAELNGDVVKGYHFGASCFYNATVSGNSVKFYDFGTSKFYFYRVN